MSRVDFSEKFFESNLQLCSAILVRCIKYSFFNFFINKKVLKIRVSDSSMLLTGEYFLILPLLLEISYIFFQNAVFWLGFVDLAVNVLLNIFDISKLFESYTGFNYYRSGDSSYSVGLTDESIIFRQTIRSACKSTVTTMTMTTIGKNFKLALINEIVL